MWDLTPSKFTITRTFRRRGGAGTSCHESRKAFWRCEGWSCHMSSSRERERSRAKWADRDEWTILAEHVQVGRRFTITTKQQEETGKEKKGRPERQEETEEGRRRKRDKKRKQQKKRATNQSKPRMKAAELRFFRIAAFSPQRQALEVHWPDHVDPSASRGSIEVYILVDHGGVLPQ